MARKSSLDRSVAELAMMGLKSARTADELRRAQAVAFPYRFGINVDTTARMIGKSCSSAARLRREFAGLAKGEELRRGNWGGRRRQNMTREEEADLLGPFFEEAKMGGILIVNPVKKAYEQAVGRSVPDSTVYRLLARHGWRKIAPDTRHPKADPRAQEEFKKNSPRSSGRKKS
jgi:transposase